MMSKKYAPIIVVGPGRSGTSCVAGILHKLGIFMGTQMIPPHDANPEGTWEDIEFVEPNELYVNQKIIDQSQWLGMIQSLIAKRQALGVRWGWKDPRTCLLLPEIVELVPDAWFIRTRRPLDTMIDSFMRSYGKSGGNADRAKTMFEERENALDTYLPPRQVLDLDFDWLRENRSKGLQKILNFIDWKPSPERQRRALEFVRPPDVSPPEDFYDVSIVIPTFNEGDWLLHTVLAINHSTHQQSIEIIVVDDGCTDDSIERLINLPNVKVVNTPEPNSGVACAKNLGAEIARGKFVCFLDSHVIVGGKWLDYLVETCQTSTTPSIVSAYLASHDSLGDATKKLTWQYGYTLGDWRMKTCWYYYGDGVSDSAFEVPLCPGGLMLLRRRWFHDLGGFAADFRKWGNEDVEFSLRNFMRGGACLVDPRTVVFHYYKVWQPWERNRTYLSREEKYFNVLACASCYFDGVEFQGENCLEQILAACGEYVDVETILPGVSRCLAAQPAWAVKDRWIRTGQDWVDHFAEQLLPASSHERPHEIVTE